MIITEATQVSELGQGYIQTPGLHSDEQVQAWRTVTDAVHAEGGTIVTQLVRGREIHLLERPHGEPRLDQFAVVHTEVPEPGDGQLLVRNQWTSVDPYMRGRMNDAPAYAALTRVAPVRRGDTVFISAAAGAVGLVAGQLARRLGAVTGIGSAGGRDKAARLVADFGFDVGLDRREGPIGAQLARAAPGGIDVYLDNVGGDHLEAAIDAARTGGRFALVGAISQYNATGPVPGPRNLYTAYAKELTLRGLLVTSYLPLFPEWIGQAAGWLADGSLRVEHTVVEGLEQAPAALLGVLRGANLGKMLVRLTDG
ncbi:MDR family NADP-dependent oxidoreductase [Nonomuraea candida]|uniref:MDR family NADP-dependent oxidoreductase n=1 Tax=Nonomuraea candida TaxID=359159 RepID=UPI001FDF5BB7|nr:NADP-dependent oxidoreductase [Nonomuraea candida]